MIGCHEGVCRPGGFRITDRAMAFCQFRGSDRLLDIGCGFGATIRHVRKEYGLSILGIDREHSLISQGKELTGELEGENLFVADARELPFKNEEFDGVFFECSLSKMDQENLALKEGFRVLKPGGGLVVSDFYAKGIPNVLSGLLGRMDSKEDILKKIEKSSFQIELFEDYSTEMKTMFGQMLLDYGCETFYGSVGAGPEEVKKVKPGYCLIIAKKL